MLIWKQYNKLMQFNATGNLDRTEGATIFFIIAEAKEILLGFSQGRWEYCNFILR